MKTRTFAAGIVSATVLASCGPDLVVSDLQTTGAPSVNSDGAVEAPVRVVVRNQGNEPAGVFKVSTHYTGGAIDPSREFVAAFTVPGQSNIWYLFTSSSLAAGAQVTIDGKVTFNPAERGVTIGMTGLADSCSGDEFMPTYCRVNERNELNNSSSPVSVPLP